MAQDIKSLLEQFIQQEQALLDQISKLKRRENVGAEISKALISEGAGALATGLFESALAGRLGKKIVKSALDQQQKSQLLVQECTIENQHNSILQKARDFLSSISINRKYLREPNSDELIGRLDRVQEFAKVDTRIKRTVTILSSIAHKPLIWNKEIRILQTEREVIISPGKPFSGSLKIEQILRSIQGYAKIIDPYVDETTLELLTQAPAGFPIKLLTEHTGGEGKERQFVRACQKFKIERPQYEARKCESGLIHDRFILTQAQGWSIGSSLKDFGKRMSMIKEMSIQSKVDAEKEFDNIWKNSKTLL